MIGYEEIEGDVISLAQNGEFDVIVHGCNCFCRQESGVAAQMVRAFSTDAFPMEASMQTGNPNKLGNIDYREQNVSRHIYEKNADGTIGEKLLSTTKKLTVVNAYTQYRYNSREEMSKIPTPVKFDYSAACIIFRKMNIIFKGQHIGMPKIGSHLAGGDWEKTKKLIQANMPDCKVTVVNYKP